MVSRWLAGLLLQLNSNPNAREGELGGVGVLRLLAESQANAYARANGLTAAEGAMGWISGGGARRLLAGGVAFGLTSTACIIEQQFDGAADKPDIPTLSTHFNTPIHEQHKRGHSHPHGPHT